MFTDKQFNPPLEMYELTDDLTLQHSCDRIVTDKQPKYKSYFFDIYISVCQNFLER